MTCRELTDFLDDYLAGELHPDERRRFDTHLADCPSCREYLRGYRDAIRLSKEALADEEAPMPPELVRAITASRRRNES